LLAFIVASLSTGCDENVDPTDPEGAYNLFRQALFKGDAKGVWKRLAPSTHQYFEDEYQRLVQMDETIDRYLPQTDHKLARRQAGSVLTDDVKDGKGLFLHVFKPKAMKLDEAEAVGAKVEEIVVQKDGKTAVIKTLGGQRYILVRGDDEQWYVMLVKSSKAVGRNMKWLDKNESALKQTVEDLIDEERKERETVIAELMDPPKPKKKK